MEERGLYSHHSPRGWAEWNHRKTRGSEWVEAVNMLCTGEFELAIDPKNRLSIPASIRSSMDPVQDGTRFFVVPGALNGTLNLVADQYFTREYAKKILSSIPPGEKRAFVQFYFYAKAVPVDIDKQGRIVLPQRSLDHAGISRQVILTGAYDHLVLWKPEVHRAFEQEKEKEYQKIVLATWGGAPGVEKGE